METIKEISKKLETVILHNEQDLHDIENLVKNIDDIKILEPLFRIFENNPDFDFGNPGNLVRIVEKFYKDEHYEIELYNSVERKPTEYNLWMLNRLLNSFDDNEKEKGITLLKNIINSKENKNVIETAKEFLEEQIE
jgi:hypothetical protein